MPSPESPLTGSCACGAVSFEITADFRTAGYCHCTRCQRRSGALWALNAVAPKDGFTITHGREHVRAWQPPEPGLPKAFCTECGGHLYADAGDVVGIRLGAVHGDPGIRPQWHQWVESAPDWEPLPDDGLPRFPRGRER